MKRYITPRIHIIEMRAESLLAISPDYEAGREGNYTQEKSAPNQSHLWEEE
ncbi:MAG: hypothetical protein HUK09_01030 [Bacteroidaceae bacterium]|nr:hypothetical protein [Bacteroidaceae bacterium]